MLLNLEGRGLLYPRRNGLGVKFCPSGQSLVFRHPFSVYVVNGLETFGTQIFLKTIFSLNFFKS